MQKIENDCEQKIIKEKLNAKELGALSERMINERKSSFNPHVITPHRMNYILPISATNHINRDAYIGTSTWSESLKDIETKFQLSIKVPLTGGNIFTTGDQFYMGFTLTSWWQVYTEDISRPFRETNFHPEFFYFAPTI